MRFMIAVLALFTVATNVLPAQAAVTVICREMDGDVVFEASGTLNVAGWTEFENSEFTEFSRIRPSASIVLVGPNPAVLADLYREPMNFVVPDNFGPGGDVYATNGTGDPIGIRSTPDTGGAELVVPEGFVSGNQISGTAVYENVSFDDLGMVVGNYAWTWGSGPDADSFRLEVRNTVPAEQSSWGMIKVLFR